MKQLNLRVSDELAASIDRAAGPRKRNAWIVALIEQELAGRRPVTAGDVAERVERVIPGAFKRKTVGDVVQARGGHVVGRMADVAPPTRAHRPGCKCPTCIALHGKNGHP